MKSNSHYVNVTENVIEDVFKIRFPSFDKFRCTKTLNMLMFQVGLISYHYLVKENQILTS